MTVAELIAELQRHDPTKFVSISVPVKIGSNAEESLCFGLEVEIVQFRDHEGRFLRVCPFKGPTIEM